MAHSKVASKLRMNSGLLNAGGGCRTAAFIALASLVNCCLELLQEAIDVLQVILGAGIGQRQRVVLGSDAAMSTAAAHAVAMVVERLEKSSSIEVATAVPAVVVSGVVSSPDREGKRVPLKAVANVVVVTRIDSTALDVTEEVVKSLDGTSPSVHALDISHGRAIWIADRAITCILVGSGAGVRASTIGESGLVRWVWVAHGRIVAGVVEVGGCHNAVSKSA